MSEDLKRVNRKFNELIEKIKRLQSINEREQKLAYFFFLEGFKEGEGMNQLVQ